MIIKPRVRGFICVTTHPAGCAASVREQIAHVAGRGPIEHGPKKVLVIGASTGYGLAARIAAAFGAGAATLGVFFERAPSDAKPGTAGWYNSAAFHDEAAARGPYAASINGDAFSDEIKQKTIDAIKRDLGQVDLVVYSVAAPRRTHPKTGETFQSTLKPIGRAVRLRGIDTDNEAVKETLLQPATPDEIAGTVAVMGGEDWRMWIDALDAAGVLADGAKTTAFTYLGEKVTHDIYWNGSIGEAKKDLDRTVLALRDKLAARGGDARVSVLKAVVTQASSAIPMMPLYLSLLFKTMKERGTHEGCIEQVDGLFRDSLYGANPHVDAEGRLRADGLELDPAVQERVLALWDRVTDDNLYTLTDFAGYKAEFLRLFGFGIDGVDYDADVDPNVRIPNLIE
ncbi:enoyl-ACP reductase FabV [Burkholderia oklahomensis]|uniref:enoyl-ACP reductase FabV n=1 Tax=Burkholderia oklahomensis TaxID=342113 RepID=UPI00016A8647|nr:enoyl-ACP reductase FabV [Burkholderia oklahomensis]AJX30767.1 NAD(P)H binding domain of trans-2-enoyl-CoA reductase family protein [Burkholderia oklahomensis C6786]AOI46259.1 trans-2-enoyl-CoA reductase [Burkholderia oklahomensis C6786]KUY53981.1 trans-2-enoyl-CoA reductase [Burkholderia oklahomensis C6786]MBI0361164.1 trans-2-enoyl-CoA reductase family protein [Burkholderia oklahomensis]SUW54860.1 Putative reductase YPO4104/y4119/YP_4011 [Burkholderia oklahomensis]